MARIRSLHPGQWTDEAFVSCSPFARLLALGLRNEADDQGVFEWKPRVLQMRLLPADNVEIDTILAELIDTDQIKKFEESGKPYGVIRNFLKYQRPKAAKAVYPLPAVLRTYAGIFELTNAAPQSEPGSEQVDANSEIQTADVIEFPRNGEIRIQMEEEGGRVKEGKEKKLRTKRVSYPSEYEDLWKAYPTDKLMSKFEGFQAWKKLDAEDRLACLQSVPAFIAYCKSNTEYRPIHLVRYIQKRRFDGMLEAGKKINERQAEVLVAYETPQWWAWDKYLRATQGRGSPKSEKLNGWHFPSEWPPKLDPNQGASV